jgi:hypothetical protein
MPDANFISRREFTLESALAILGAATITISGCSSDNSMPTNPTTNSGDVSGSISANHGHIAVIRAAQLSSPSSIVVDIRGNADHPHIVELSASEVAQIGDRVRVSKQSSTDNFHNHTVSFN